MYFKGAIRTGHLTIDSFLGLYITINDHIYYTYVHTIVSTAYGSLIYLCLHLVFKPFRCPAHNYTMIAMLTATLGLLWAAILDNIHFNLNHLFPAAMALLSLSVPFFYLFGLGCVLIKKVLKGLIS